MFPYLYGRKLARQFGFSVGFSVKPIVSMRAWSNKIFSERAVPISRLRESHIKSGHMLYLLSLLFTRLLTYMYQRLQQSSMCLYSFGHSKLEKQRTQ